jgi:hypothetical protein
MALTTVRPQGIAFRNGRRNIVINGAMQVAQRGTSSTASDYGTCDRWVNSYSGGTLTQTQTAITSGSPYDEGFRHVFKVTNTTAGGTAAAKYCQIMYRVEAQDIATSGWKYTDSNSYITFSFWVKVSLAGTYYAWFYTEDGTNKQYAHPFTVTANTWKKVEMTVPGDSGISFNNDTGIGTTIHIIPHYGTNYTADGTTTGSWLASNSAARFPDQDQDWMGTSGTTFEITGVQLEVGEDATQFEHRTYGEELALCQRYFYKFDSGDGTNLHGGSYATNSWVGDCYFPVTMRAAPTISNTTGSYTTAASGIGKRKFYVYKSSAACYITTFDASAEL